MSLPAESKREPSRGYFTALLVVLVSLGVGLFVLPRLTHHVARSDSALIGQPAPDFMLSALSAGSSAKPVRLSDAQGKVVLLDFFASWCGPCREQAPIVERVARRLAGPTVAVYGVNTSDGLADAQHYLAEHTPSYPVLFDADNEAANAFGVTGLPTLLVIDAHGLVRAVEMRVVGQIELEQLIEEAGHALTPAPH